MKNRSGVLEGVAAESVLEGALDGVALPTRMANFAIAKGLITVGQLARLHPAALLLERNLGRKSVADTRSVLEPILGCPWEFAAEGGAVTGDDDPPSQAGRSRTHVWDELKRLLPESVMSRSLHLVALPARLRTFATARGLVTVADLVEIQAAELWLAPNLGRASLKEGPVVLLALKDEDAKVLRSSEWRVHLLEALARLERRMRMVLTQRAGLLGIPPTLTELGESLGVSRERIRQLETAAMIALRQQGAWLPRLGDGLRELCPPIAGPLDAIVVEGNALVGQVEEDFEPFRFLINELLDGAAGYVFVYDETPFWGKSTEHEFLAKLAILNRSREALVFPLDEADLLPSLASASGLALAEVSVLLSLGKSDFVHENGRVTGFGSRRADVLLAFLRGEGKPVPVAQVVEKCGRFPLPAEVVWLDRGLVTLAEFVPGFDVWKKRLGPVVATLIAEHGEDRQWTTAELLPLLALVADLPEWMNAHALGSLIRDAEQLTYLGRNVVALASTQTKERTYLLEALEEELSRAGEPIKEAALLERVRVRRGLADLTWTMQRVRSPFLLLESGYVGLSPRDIPGGKTAEIFFCASVFEWLEGRERGVGSQELAMFLAKQPEPICTWDRKLVRSLLRHDGRFRQAPGGGLGLVVWGETRMPSQKEALLTLLKRDAPPSIEEALMAIPTSSGEPMSRGRLALLAGECGARLKDGYVTWREQAPKPEPSPDSWTARMPEKAAPIFAHCLQNARARPELVRAIHEWRDKLLALNTLSVDRDQVMKLSARALRLLEAPRLEASPTLEHAARAAVEYVVCVDDGEADSVVGGLDDDEAVLDVVERTIGELDE